MELNLKKLASTISDFTSDGLNHKIKNWFSKTHLNAKPKTVISNANNNRLIEKKCHTEIKLT